MIHTDMPAVVLIQSPRSKNVLSRLFERIMDLFKRIFFRKDLPDSSKSLEGRVVAELPISDHGEPAPMARDDSLFEAPPQGPSAAEILDIRMEKGSRFPTFEAVFQSFMDGELKQPEEVKKTEAPRSFSALQLLNLRMGLPLDTPLF